MLPTKYHNIVAKKLRQTNWENDGKWMLCFAIVFLVISIYFPICIHSRAPLSRSQTCGATTVSRLQGQGHWAVYFCWGDKVLRHRRWWSRAWLKHSLSILRCYIVFECVYIYMNMYVCTWNCIGLMCMFRCVIFQLKTFSRWTVSSCCGWCWLHIDKWKARKF